MPPRYDISGIPLQGGYVAKQCPVRAQNDTLQPAEPIPPDPFRRRLYESGNAFEAEIFAEVIALHAGAVVITDHGRDAEEATLAAMQRATPVILGGRLPSDQVGRRVGRPDILVAAAGGGYRAVDVKWHLNLEPASAKDFELPGRSSSLSALDLEAAMVDPQFAAKKRGEDVLQLAHYQRMLEAVGVQATDGTWGGIIGTERRVVWYDLAAPIWRTRSSSQQTKRRSTMDRYEFEFDFRLDVVAVAEQHKRDPSIPLLTVPVKISECESCPWWDYCRPQLEESSGDVSLLPRIGWTQWKVHRDHGVTTRAELAELDPRTARLVAGGVDVAALMKTGEDVDLAEVASEKALTLLADEGIATTADLQGLCSRTASYSDASLGALPTHIDLARAALGPQPVYRRRGVSELAITRADVEVDIDMENTEAGCYMWGSYVTDCSGNSIAETGYRAFVSWEALTPAVEAENSLRFWRWLMNVRQRCQDAGLTFAAYCYNASAENAYLRRLGTAKDALADEIEGFIASDEWIDILKVWDSQVITGGSSSLKSVAPLVGFRWEIDDPGGGESMIKHDLAVHGDRDVQNWLLKYNRGDVEATLAVREWMVSAEVLAIDEGA
jgi:predicted RecB family nuclease